MSQRSPDTPPDLADEFDRLPLDPDLEPAEDQSRRGSGQPAASVGRRRRSRWPRIHWWSVGAVGAGGFLGGLARYGIGLAWVSPVDTFPWATFAINTSGAFLLALLLVLVLDVLPPTTYLRPALGTGFCGAFTTFSSVVVATDQMAAHGQADTAAIYVAGSVFAGLAAASYGMLLGRSIAANQSRRGKG